MARLGTQQRRLLRKCRWTRKRKGAEQQICFTINNQRSGIKPRKVHFVPKSPDRTSLPASIWLTDGKPGPCEARTDTVHDRFRIEHGCTGLCASYAWIVLEQIT